MYIERVPNRGFSPTILVRSSRREGDKIVKTTHANVTGLPKEILVVLELLLQGKTMLPVDEAFKILRSRPHGHVEAILGLIRKLELDRIISSTPSKERDLVLAMIVSRLIEPCSKLALTKLWKSTTLAEELNVANATEDDLYNAMDWLVKRQSRIETKLAAKHLKGESRNTSSVVLYDVSSSSYYGEHCPLVKRGYNRDGLKLPQIVYGLLTNKEGCPVTVDVYEGSTSDSTTVTDQVLKLRERFGVERAVLVGDRGMLTSTQIEKLKEHDGLGWISALRSSEIKRLLEEGQVQLGLFDERNLVEITSEDYLGERLMVCRNPMLMNRRRHERESLLEKTESGLAKVKREAERRSSIPLTESEIGDKSGRVLDKYKMRKHFKVDIAEGKLSYERKLESIKKEERLDGIYIVRTSEAKEAMESNKVVKTYKSLSQVEDAFRCIKGVDIEIRPIRHHLESRVRGHVFICLLSYYVEWHMRQALKSLLYMDEAKESKEPDTDPVKPVKASPVASKKKTRGKMEEGREVYDWRSLIRELGTCCRNTCEVKTGKFKGEFEIQTEHTSFQGHVLSLLDLNKKDK